ncbi:MAG: hypothetical protein ACRD38_05100 [Nitrososphaerales archaeon]
MRHTQEAVLASSLLEDEFEQADSTSNQTRELLDTRIRLTLINVGLTNDDAKTLTNLLLSSPDSVTRLINAEVSYLG